MLSIHDLCPLSDLEFSMFLFVCLFDLILYVPVNFHVLLYMLAPMSEKGKVTKLTLMSLTFIMTNFTLLTHEKPKEGT